MPTPNDDKQDFQDVAELSDRLDQATEAIGGLVRQLQSNTGDALVARAITRLENELRRQLNSMVRDIVTSLLEGQLGSAGGGGRAGGVANFFTSFLPRLARGGVVDGASLLALGGEAGPEAVLPLKRMPDGRLGVVAQTGTQATKNAPPQIIVNLTPASALDGAGDGGEVSQGLSDEMAEMITRAIDDAVDTRLAEHQRYGGMLNRIGGERL